MSSDLRNDSIRNALDRALAGEPTALLHRALAIASGLPGPRPNLNMVSAFAIECARHGAKVDPILNEMATLNADLAQGGTAFEIVPMCGIAALGERAASDNSARLRIVALLHSCADDLR